MCTGAVRAGADTGRDLSEEPAAAGTPAPSANAAAMQTTPLRTVLGRTDTLATLTWH